jgi:hypothetical protein
MPSTGNETVSLSNFQLIIDGFLRYADTTGVELAKDPFINELQSLQSPDDLLRRFQERENAFKEYRNRNRGLIDCLSPAVQVLQKLSGVLGEVASPVNPAKAIFVGIDVLLEVRPLNLLRLDPPWRMAVAMPGCQWGQFELWRSPRPLWVHREFSQASRGLYEDSAQSIDDWYYSENRGWIAVGAWLGDDADPAGSPQWVLRYMHYCSWLNVL